MPLSRVANYENVDRDATKRGMVKNMWELEGKIRTFKFKCTKVFLLYADFVCKPSELARKIF